MYKKDQTQKKREYLLTFFRNCVIAVKKLKIESTCLVYLLNILVASKRGEKSFLVKALKVLRAIFLEGHPSLPLDTAWKMKESVDFSAINIPISNVLIYEEGFNVEDKKVGFFRLKKNRLSVL